MKNTKLSSWLVIPPYVIGAALGLYLIVIAAWADMESAFYGFSRLADPGLRGFHCPVLMTRSETSAISLDVANTTGNKNSPAVKVEISTPLLMQEYLENLELMPGESRRLEWPVGPENIDLGQFIFAKALMFSAYPMPSREATCGIFVVDLPGRGSVILPILVALCVLGLGWGAYGFGRTGISQTRVMKYSPMNFLAILILLGMIVSFMGGWVPSIVILAVVLIVTMILLGSFIMSERTIR